ncbi:hypothetical protein OC842_000176 [Tilletia horrida]|uniref:Phytochrome n=1 Tax=Tilletia horrida TaxID=155126 RepID=A0AAN6JN20_9BASI|nr:hypothetical protein OC842_000176 [Tilletia horrida]
MDAQGARRSRPASAGDPAHAAEDAANDPRLATPERVRSTSHTTTNDGDGDGDGGQGDVDGTEDTEMTQLSASALSAGSAGAAMAAAAEAEAEAEAEAAATAAKRPNHTRASSSHAQPPYSGSAFIYPIRSAVKVRPTTSSESGSYSNKSLDSVGGGAHSRGMSVAMPSPSDIPYNCGTSIDSRSPSSQTFMPQYYSHQLGGSSPPANLNQSGLERSFSQGGVSIDAHSRISSAASVLSGGEHRAPNGVAGLTTAPLTAAAAASSSAHSDQEHGSDPTQAPGGQSLRVDSEYGGGGGGGEGVEGATLVNADVTAPAARPTDSPTGESGFANAGDHSWEGQTTMRFTHVQTEEGHMVLTGRDGKLLKCEDEPIHIPGAIQSFGCMIVVREDEEGVLVVRQCSENTDEILSLTPAYLFSLPSFLDCMDDDQADILWDNIEALNESPEELNETGPTVFRLHGWGQPGPGTGKARARKHWDVWCAAHRPEGQRSDGIPPLIVLEFELVHDQLYPRDPQSTELQSESILPPSFSEEDRASSTGEIRAVRGDVDEREPVRRPSTVTASTIRSDSTTTDSDRTTRSTSGSATPSTITATSSSSAMTHAPRGGLEGQPYIPAAEDVAESTMSTSKPLKALARMRLSKQRRTAAGGTSRRRQGAGGPGIGSGPGSAGGDMDDVSLDMFGILSQANEQLAAQTDLQSFLKVAVSIVREITTFSRVMIYQFDEQWNGQVVCELVNWNDTHDLYRGLHFPASDIPAQARAMYKVNKVRLLYDRAQTTSRMVCRDESDLSRPVDMTHCFLRAMSPIHIKYLENMGVRASMSISIIAFDQLWGLIALHTYGDHGKRVSFPVRQLSRLIGDSVSRNIERLSYTRRLSARKLINTLPTDKNPSGYIISNAEDLLALFDADFGIIAIGQEAKLLGPLDASQEVLAITEYLRIKRFDTVVTSSEMLRDFPDMIIPTALKTIAGLLVVPLTPTGGDFIAFLRKAQLRQINWAGKPFKEGKETSAVLDPRKSFKKWSETVEGTCRAWKDEELETASVLCLVYGKFISVWRQREQAIQHNQMNKLLLSNASHEVRTPLNHIINYLELALDGPLDTDTRDNLSKSHLASKSLLFVINDLLDLTRQEEGRKLYLQEPFDLSSTLREAVEMHESEAKRRKIHFSLELHPEQCMVLGDKNKVRQIVVNSVTNAVSHTKEGQVTVAMYKRTGSEMTTSSGGPFDMEAEIVISDTGIGIPKEKLEAIFREFEEVETVLPNDAARGDAQAADENGAVDETMRQAAPRPGTLGLGLAINARIVKNLGGQLRVQSTVGEGSRFTYFIPFCSEPPAKITPGSPSAVGGSQQMRRTGSRSSGGSGSSASRSEIDSLVEALNAPHLGQEGRSAEGTPRRSLDSANSFSDLMPTAGVRLRPPTQKQVFAHDFATMERGGGSIPIEGSNVPLRSVKVDPHQLDAMPPSPDYFVASAGSSGSSKVKARGMPAVSSSSHEGSLPSPLASREREGSTNASSADAGAGAGRRVGGVGGSASAGASKQSSREPLVSPRTSDSTTSAPGPAGPGPSSSNHNADTPLSEAMRGLAVSSPPMGGAANNMASSPPAEPRRVGSGSGPSSAAAALQQKTRLSRGKIASPSSAKPPVPSLRALVVEDDPINAAILKKRLLLDGHTVSVAVNGEEGVRHFLEHSNEIDLVLMDLQMPICNGRDACRRIRHIEKDRAAQRELTDRPASHVLNGGVPILAVSATLTEDMREELQDIGFDAWILKPIDFLRLAHIKKGITNLDFRASNLWRPGYDWERGGWLHEAAQRSVE